MTQDLQITKLLQKKLLKNSFRLYFFSYLSAPLGYCTRIILSNDLSITEVGVIYSILGFIGLLSAYNGLGLTEALKYFIPTLLIKKDFNSIKTIVLLSRGTQILMSIFIILGIWFGSGFLAVEYFHTPEITPLLQIFCLYFLGINILQTLSAIFLSFQDSFSAKIMDFIMGFTTLLLIVLYYRKGESGIFEYGLARIFGGLAAVILGTGIYLLKYHPLLKQGHFTWKVPFLKIFGKYALRTFLGMNGGFLLGRIDQQMLIAMQGGELAGYYTNYLSLLNLFTILVTPLSIILVPLFTDLIHKGNTTLELIKKKVYSYLMIFSFSLATLLVSIAPEIVTFLYGTKYLPSSILLRIATPFYLFSILTTLNFTFLSALGKVKERTLGSIGVGILNIILNFFLIKRFGMYGALSSTIVSWIILYLCSRFLTKEYKPQWEGVLIRKNIFLCIGLSSGIFFLFRCIPYTEFSPLFKGILLGGTGLIYYSILLRVNKPTIKEGFKLLKHPIL